MGHTVTIRVPEDLAKWLADTADRTGMSQGQVVREQLEHARSTGRGRPFMRLAGSVDGPRDLSSRKGFSRQ
jgi:hypothetical protein